MPIDIIIRPATGSDQPELAQLGNAVQNDHAAVHPRIFRPESRHWGQPTSPSCWRTTRRPCWWWNSTAASPGALWNSRQAPGYPVFQPRTMAVVDVLVVDPAMRGRGIGCLLMNAARAWATSRGATSLLDLDVW